MRRNRYGVAGDEHAHCRATVASGCSAELLERIAKNLANHGDKAMTVKRDKVGQAFGRIDAETMLEIERCLAVFLGIAK